MTDRDDERDHDPDDTPETPLDEPKPEPIQDPPTEPGPSLPYVVEAVLGNGSQTQLARAPGRTGAVAHEEGP